MKFISPRPIICPLLDCCISKGQIAEVLRKTNMRKGTKWQMCGHNDRTGQVQLVYTMCPPPTQKMQNFQFKTYIKISV